MYIHERPEWPNFTWQHAQLEPVADPLLAQQLPHDVTSWM